MNVLVYNGPGASQTSVAHTLSTLRALLIPNYTVQPITPQVLANEPWSINCALLVLPGGRDLPYISALKASNDKIVSYVRGGGAFLGICAGAYYACRRVEWEVGTPMEVCGDRPLCFFNNIGRGCVYPGFDYESDAGARAVKVLLRNPSESSREERVNLEGLYYNGGGEFVDAHATHGIEVLGDYVDGEGKGKAAGIFSPVGKGSTVLWAIHPEYPLTSAPALQAITKAMTDVSHQQVKEMEEGRLSLMKSTLTRLRLILPAAGIPQTLKPLPQFLTSTEPAGKRISTFWDAFNATCGGQAFKDTNDIFQLHSPENTEGAYKSSSNEAKENEVRHIVIHSNGTMPSILQTPSFDLSQYYSALSIERSRIHGQVGEEGIGDVVLYGEIVTSTQTMLDKNTRLLSMLPTPLLSIAAQQLSGRGRGSNSWLSPPGCLQFSLLLRLSLSSFPASRLVFIQYLFGLAVVEACRSEAVLGRLGDRVRLKWPNDIYAILDNGGMKKIGGILVNTSFSGGTVNVVVGCGLNVLSPDPLTSLSHFASQANAGTNLSMERTAAAIMVSFGGMWKEFVRADGSFDPFVDQYLERWLHSDQIVTLTTVDPPIRVRIVGITSDYGFLRTMPENQGYQSNPRDAFIDLHPDGNSFDIMAGLIKVKK